MRAGPGTVGVIALALAVGSAVADAQSITRPLPAKGEATVTSTSLVPTAGQPLPGALLTTPSTSVGLEQFEFEAHRAVEEDEDEDDEGAFWGTGLGGLPGGSAYRGIGAPAARTGFAGSRFASFPALRMLRRALRSGSAGIPDATRARLVALADAQHARFLAAIGADADAADRESIGAFDSGVSVVATGGESRGRGNRSLVAETASALPSVNVPGRTESAARHAFDLGGAVNAGSTPNATLPGLATPELSAAAAAVVVTPEPASLALIGTGIAALGIVARRRRIF